MQLHSSVEKRRFTRPFDPTKVRLGEQRRAQHQQAWKNCIESNASKPGKMCIEPKTSKEAEQYRAQNKLAWKNSIEPKTR